MIIDFMTSYGCRYGWSAQILLCETALRHEIQDGGVREI